MNGKSQARTGASLAELLVVMSACTLVLSTSAALIHRAMHAQSGARSFYDDERSALRLSHQFRRDLHDAVNVTLVGDSEPNSLLHLAFPDQSRVEYRHDQGRIERILRRENEVTAREEFSFRSPIALAVREEPSPQRIILSAEGSAEREPASAQRTSSTIAAHTVFQIEACLGESRRREINPPLNEESE